MDPISLIIAALVAGGSAGVKDTASTAVADAYASLKGLLRRRLGDRPEAEAELERLDDRPGDRQALAAQLRVAGAEHDQELIAKARELLATADPDGARAGVYDVTITGGQGVVVGDRANVTMRFGGD